MKYLVDTDKTTGF